MLLQPVKEFRWQPLHAVRRTPNRARHCADCVHVSAHGRGEPLQVHKLTITKPQCQVHGRYARLVCCSPSTQATPDFRSFDISLRRQPLHCPRKARSELVGHAARGRLAQHITRRMAQHYRGRGPRDDHRPFNRKWVRMCHHRRPSSALVQPVKMPGAIQPNDWSPHGRSVAVRAVLERRTGCLPPIRTARNAFEDLGRPAPIATAPPIARGESARQVTLID